MFYLKVGLDPVLDEQRLDIVRNTIGPQRRLRIDANQSWSVAEAAERIERWHRLFRLDWVEGPVRQRPLANLQSLRSRTAITLCADEGLRGEEYAYEIVRSARCANPGDRSRL